MKRVALPIVATLLAVPAVAQDRSLTLESTEIYRAGGADAQEEWAFFGPGLQLRFDEAGILVVLDALNKRVVVIGPDGQLVRVIGREGEGPGEFRSAMAFAVWRDGRFAVPDLGHSAIQVFSPEGELERFVRMNDEDRPGSSALFHSEIRADQRGERIIARGVGGVLVAMANRMNRRMGYQEDETSSGVDDRALETLDFSGDVVVSRPILQGWRAPRLETGLSPADEADWGQVVASMEDRYFEPGFHWDVLPDGTLAYSDSTAYAIRLASPDGSVTDVLRRPLSPEPVSARIRRATIAYHLERLEERLERPPSTGLPFMAPDPEGRRRRIRERGFYHEIPVVRGLKATWDGGLWIQRRGEDPWDDDGSIDVFSPDREYLGTLPAGDPGMPAAFGPDGLVVHLERDELDVPTLVVSRLTSARPQPRSRTRSPSRTAETAPPGAR
ncbi:MAG: hypothetical protein F4043_13515 [Gammaproteobacteria bacterium]|nr:hypothetical protein [Gammaproteobacteria bacterium]MYI23702.1 hypothetical protein [Gammaproteobacteria bacterium]